MCRILSEKIGDLQSTICKRNREILDLRAEVERLRNGLKDIENAVPMPSSFAKFLLSEDM